MRDSARSRPSVLDERGREYFDDYYPNRSCCSCSHIRKDKRDVIPAVTTSTEPAGSSRCSARATRSTTDLIEEFERRTGVPVVLNTSFNLRAGHVHRPEEALADYLNTGMDALIMGNTVSRRSRSNTRSPVLISSRAPWTLG